MSTPTTRTMAESSVVPPAKWFNYSTVVKTLVVSAIVVVTIVVLYYGSIIDNFGERFTSFYGLNFGSSFDNKTNELNNVLKAAATEEKTVIITTLNDAWAEPNSIYDVFLESFRVGNNTAKLLDHLVVIAIDEKAYDRCKATVSHCYLLKTKQYVEMAHDALFMTPLYLDMMWERLAFLKSVLSLGYNFVFTDTDVTWFRSPFQHFTPDSDFQTSCDRFNGLEWDVNNSPNNGFVFVRSNKRTIKFYKYWVSLRRNYPGLHDQDVFNQIKNDFYVKFIGLKTRFLDTNYFGGFCETSKDFDKVCTMHANCCVGLDRKIADLKTSLEDWKAYFYSNQTQSEESIWSVPRECHM